MLAYFAVYHRFLHTSIKALLQNVASCLQKKIHGFFSRGELAKLKLMSRIVCLDSFSYRLYSLG